MCVAIYGGQQLACTTTSEVCGKNVLSLCCVEQLLSEHECECTCV